MCHCGDDFNKRGQRAKLEICINISKLVYIALCQIYYLSSVLMLEVCLSVIGSRPDWLRLGPEPSRPGPSRSKPGPSKSKPGPSRSRPEPLTPRPEYDNLLVYLIMDYASKSWKIIHFDHVYQLFFSKINNQKLTCTLPF